MKIRRGAHKCLVHNFSSLSIDIGLTGLLFCVAFTTRTLIAARSEFDEPATTVYYVSTSGNDQWSDRQRMATTGCAPNRRCSLWGSSPFR